MYTVLIPSVVMGSQWCKLSYYTDFILTYTHTSILSILGLQLTGETEALLFPVFRVVYSRSDDLLHQILRIGAFDGLGIFLRSIRHIFTVREGLIRN